MQLPMSNYWSLTQSSAALCKLKAWGNSQTQRKVAGLRGLATRDYYSTDVRQPLQATAGREPIHP